jgi:hypothetical protein
VWLVALAATEIATEGGEPIVTLQAGERVRAIASGTGAVLVALPDGSGSGWVPLDPRVQFVAQ